MNASFPLKVGRLLAVISIALFPITSHAVQLSADEIQLIADFEDASGQPFEEFFAKVVHQRELCHDTNSVCEVALQKRSDNFHVLFRGQDNMLTDQSADAANRALSTVFDDIGFLTNNWPIYEKPKGTQKYIFFVFVNRATYEASPEVFIQARVARENFGQPVVRERRERLFRNFMKSDLPCMAVMDAFDDGIIRDAHIWIKSELSDQGLEKCIAEEIFNTMGIDEGVDSDSIFDWPLSNFDRNKGLSDLHLLLLKLLYQPDFKHGQSKGETLFGITEMLSSKE